MRQDTQCLYSLTNCRTYGLSDPQPSCAHLRYLLFFLALSGSGCETETEMIKFVQVCSKDMLIRALSASAFEARNQNGQICPICSSWSNIKMSIWGPNKRNSTPERNMSFFLSPALPLPFSLSNYFSLFLTISLVLTISHYLPSYHYLITSHYFSFFFSLSLLFL